MVRLTAFAAVVLGLVLTVPARAQSAESAISDARGLVRRAALPFVGQAEADRCVSDLARALLTGRGAVQSLAGAARARAADDLNLTTINASFGRVTATRGIDVTRDLLPIGDALAFLELDHLTDGQRERVRRVLRVLHDLSRRSPDARLTSSVRADVARDLDACEGDLRTMVNDPALATYLRGLAFHHAAIVRSNRAHHEWRGGAVTLHREWPLAHVSTIVDKAYADARTPGVGPSPASPAVDLRGLPASTRTGAVLPCALRLDAPDAPKVARWDVETIDAAGDREWLTHVAPASTSFDLFAPSRPGRHVVLVSALLEDDRVLARAFALEVTGAEVPTITLGPGPTELPPTVGLVGVVRGEGAIRVALNGPIVADKGGSIRIDFDGSTPVSFRLELVAPGPGGERRVICRDEPLHASATQGTTMVLSLGAHEVPEEPIGWQIVVTARRTDGTTQTAHGPLSPRATRRIS